MHNIIDFVEIENAILKLSDNPMNGQYEAKF